MQIVETDFPEIREVDLKLIELARQLNGKIVTNDFNLNKVAQLRGVPVLNINELANSLKPVVLPGEVMRVFIIKEGKEAGQGVAYLDDGTMVVVDQAQEGAGPDDRGDGHERAADDRGQDDLLPLGGVGGPPSEADARREAASGRAPGASGAKAARTGETPAPARRRAPWLRSWAPAVPPAAAPVDAHPSVGPAPATPTLAVGSQGRVAPFSACSASFSPSP